MEFDIIAQGLTLALVLLLFVIYQVRKDFFNAVKLKFFKGGARKVYVLRQDNSISEEVLVKKSKFVWGKNEIGLAAKTVFKKPDFTVAVPEDNKNFIQEMAVNDYTEDGRMVLNPPKFRVRHTGVPAHLVIEGLPTDVGARELRELSPTELAVELNQRINSTVQEERQLGRLEMATSLFDKLKNDPRIFYLCVFSVIGVAIVAIFVFQQSALVTKIAEKVGVDMSSQKLW